MPDLPSPQLHRWDDVPREKVSDLLHRRLICGERLMLAQVSLQKGCVIPAHSHDNEQVTYVLDGALHIWLGEDGRDEIVVHGGEVLVLPPNVRHKGEALEDTVVIDVFCPPRLDWLQRTDTYLRAGVDDMLRG